MYCRPSRLQFAIKRKLLLFAHFMSIKLKHNEIKRLFGVCIDKFLTYPLFPKMKIKRPVDVTLNNAMRGS